MPKFPWNGWAYAWGRKRGDVENLVKDVKQDIEQEARQDIGQEQKAETSQENDATLFSYNSNTGHGPVGIFVHSIVSADQNNASETSQQQTAGQEAEQKADNEFAVEQQAGAGNGLAWGRKRGDVENLVKDVKQDIEQEARQDIGQEQKAETSQANTAVLFSYNTKTGNGPDYIFVHSTVSVTQNNASETSQQQTAGQEAEQKADNEFAVEQQAGTGLSYPNDSVWG